MVNYLLEICASLHNLTDFQPHGGCDDHEFTYNITLKCEVCRKKTQAIVSFNEEELSPNGQSVHLSLEGRGRPLTEDEAADGIYSPLMLFDCQGYEPVHFYFEGEWQAISLTTDEKIDVLDLTEGLFEDNGKDRNNVAVLNLCFKFNITQ